MHNSNRLFIFLIMSVFVVFLGYSNPKPTYFNYTTNTGNNATITLQRTADITVNGEPLQPGDEIGVFTPDSLCVGAVVWKDSSTAITVWGNNEQTSIVDGIKHAEQMHFRIWKKDIRTEYLQTDVTFSDESPATGSDTYQENGIYIIESLVADIVVNISQNDMRDVIPESFSLEQNYPNPFNPSTTIGYAVPEANHVRITVFNLVGQKVEEIVNGFHAAGRYEVIFEADSFSSGVYLYRMETGNFAQTKKFILLQ